MKKNFLLLIVFAVMLQAVPLFADGDDSTLAAYKSAYASYLKTPTAALKNKIAALEPAAKPLVIAECTKKSGLDDQTKDMPALIKAMSPVTFADAGIEQTPEKLKMIDEMTDGIFNSGKLMNGIRAYLEKYYSAGPLLKFLSWLDSETGMKMTALEVAAGRNPEQMMEYIKSFSEDTLPESRLAVMNEFGEAIEKIDMQSRLSATMAKQLCLGFNETAPESRKIPDEKISALESSVSKNSVSEASKKTSLAMHVYTYKKATDAEMRKYIAHINSAEGLWTHKAISNAMIYSMGTASRTYGKFMGKQATERSLRVPGWQEFVFKEEKYRVMMPAVPTLEEQDIATDAGSKHLSMRTAATDDAYYIVSTTLDYIEEEIDEEITKKVLTGAAKGSAQDNKIISAKFINAGGYPAIDVVFTGKGVTTYNRIILAGLDFYQVMYICAENDTSVEKRNVFLNSFKLDK